MNFASSAFWTPLSSFMVVALIYVLSETLSTLLNGNVSSLMFASVFFMAGFWSGLFPENITTMSDLVPAMTKFGVALLITNLGTLIDLETLLDEWRTVLVAFFGLFGIAIVAFTIGPVLFGREYALVAAPPIAGGTIAGLIMQEAANAAGRPELAAFAVLVLAFQQFFGMPVATIGLKKEVKMKKERGDFKAGAKSGESKFKLPAMRIFKPLADKYNTSTMHLFKLSFVAVVANLVAQQTLIPGSSPANYILNPNIAYLLFGLIFTRIGFLDKSALQKSQSYGLTIFGLMVMLQGSFAKISPEQVVSMIVPLVGMLGLSLIGICAIAVFVGKLVGYSPWISMAVACTCMFGYPATEILSNEVAASMVTDDEAERQRALEFVMPKMIVAGFVTVTIASVAFAAVVAPTVF